MKSNIPAIFLLISYIQTIMCDTSNANFTTLQNTSTAVVLLNSTTSSPSTIITESRGKPYHHRSAPRLPKKINDPNQLAIDLENKLDDTIIGAIVMGSIFLFITLSVTITVIIFCLKKNTVFVFQKSEQEDIQDNYDETSSCHSNNFFNQNHRYFINHYRNPTHFQNLFTTTPIPTNNHHSNMTHNTNTNHRHPTNTHNMCQCCCNKPILPPQSVLYNNNPEFAPWHKLHTQTKFKPMFSQLNDETTKNSNNENSNTKVQMSNNLNIKFDYINNKRAINRKQSDNDIDITSIHRPPTQPETMSPLLSHNEISTPLGKSQTYQELKPLQSSPTMSNDANNDNCSIKLNNRRLQKSQSNYDSSNILKETKEF